MAGEWDIKEKNKKSCMCVRREEGVPMGIFFIFVVVLLMF